MPDQSSAASEHALMQEITAPLEALPDDPLGLVDAEFPAALRGYDRHAVDDYVEQVRELVAELRATRSPEAAVRRALERVGEQISGILQRAHETAEQITAQSRSEAEDRLERARQEAAELVDAAERRVRELDADTDRIWGERQQIVTDAEALSEQLRQVAREAATRFPDGEWRDVAPPGADGDGDAGDGTVAETSSADDTAVQAPTVEQPAAEESTVDDAAEEEARRRAKRLTELPTRIIPPASEAAQHRDGET